MIQAQTVVKVGDNSGVKRVRCIKVMGKNKNYARTGQLIKVSIISVGSNSKYKRGQVVNAIVIRESKFLSRGSCRVKFNQSAVSLLNSSSDPIATRIFGPVPMELKQWNLNIFNIAINVV
ncbi:MAG: uL14 family ribosomal protein [Candidatus Hodgkinia cicadicola]